MVPGGHGLARLSDGRLVLASGVAPGDLLQPTRFAQRRGADLIASFELLEPGPERVVPVCPLAGRCGGCDWMHLSQHEQAASKISILRDALRRTGAGAGLGLDIQWVSPGPRHGYRQRLRLHVTPSGLTGLRAVGSSQVVPVQHCAVARPEVDRALGALCALEKPARASLVRSKTLEVRASPELPELTFRVAPVTAPAWPGATLARALRELGPVVLQGTREDRELVQLYPLPRGVVLEAPVSAFTQVHPEVNAELVETVVAGAQRRGLRTFLEPYAGAGNFTLPLLAAGLNGRASDANAAAISAARCAARRQGLPFDGFDIADAGRWLRARAQSSSGADLVLLDPPRHGARDDLTAAMALAQRAMVLIACDPVSLARDLRSLDAAGWYIESLTAFDMFPETHHVETVAWLSRTHPAA